MKEIYIPAKTGVAFEVRKGEIFKIIDVFGKQVGDMVLFVKERPHSEYFSTSHTRSCLKSIYFRKGDSLFSNHRNPLLTLLEDTVGVHDIIVPCCDAERYERDYGIKGHPNCRDNLINALNGVGMTFNEGALLDAINVFMNNQILPTGEIVTLEPPSRPGDFAEFKALEDLIVGISACPQDLTPCNGYNPSDLKVVIE